MIFRQLFDTKTSTYTYLLADETSRKAVLIDTVFEKHQRDLALLRELELEPVLTLDTHVHADHVTGAWLLRDATTCRIGFAKNSGVEGADVYLSHGDPIVVGSLKLEARETPGHTDGCMTFVLEDRSMAFTGDTLLIRGAGRTDFQQGDARRLYHSVRDHILSLPPDCSLYPGHDYNGRTMSTVAEERAHNPRLGDAVREDDFVGYMQNLGLPHPERMKEAVPANLRCGEPAGSATPRQPTWAPVVRTFAGVLQVDPEWLHEHRDEVTVLDVRETGEIEAMPMGMVPGAQMIPLSALRDRLDDIPREFPVVAICPAGARSAQAALILEKAGIENAANLAGGLFRWRALGFPLD